MRLCRFIAFALILLLPLASACRKGDGAARRTNKLQVVTTLFPLYDFARVVGGERVEAVLLLPPGVEPHNFEPRPEDILRLAKADLFIYTNRYLEPWADGIIKGVDNRGLVVVDASAGVTFIPLAEERGDDGHGHGEGEGMDPHVWLSIPNAKRMVENIRDGLLRKDPAGSDQYRQNAATYLARLDGLDSAFRAGLADCGQRLVLHGGHHAFGYLAQQYGLKYLSAYAATASAEPGPRRIMELTKVIRANGVKAVFYEELLSPRLAQTISRETGATLLKLHGVHNVTRDELAAGVTYLSLMEQNLGNLRSGLQCR